MKSLLARPDEVRAFLSGKKTMMRRVVRIDAAVGPDASASVVFGEGHGGRGWYAHDSEYPDEGSVLLRLPYAPGDTVAVKETWAQKPECKYAVAYKADGARVGVMHDSGGGYIRIPHGWILDGGVEQHGKDGDYCGLGKYGGKWRSSTQMPLYAVRLHLVVTAVKVERLQSISEADAHYEGTKPRPPRSWIHCGDIIGEFRRSWDSHAKPGERWSDNPFVVAYTVEVEHDR